MWYGQFIINKPKQIDMEKINLKLKDAKRGERFHLCDTWLNVSDHWVKARLYRTENGDLECQLEDAETLFPMGTSVQGFNDEIIISKYDF